MQENIPLTIERLPGEQERECRITSARQIQSLLRGVLVCRSPAALYFDGAKDFILTPLLGVGEEGLWVGQSPEITKNQCIIESGGIILVSLVDQVKIQFSAEGVQAVMHQDYPAFHLPLPECLYRVQRREFFRLAVPPSEQLRCVIPINRTEGAELVEVAVADIGGGGLRFSCAEKDIEFAVGQTYAGCRIDLPDVGTISVTMTVKNLFQVSAQPGQSARNVGCEFRNLDNASGILLHRYVTMMQRIMSQDNGT